MLWGSIWILNKQSSHICISVCRMSAEERVLRVSDATLKTKQEEHHAEQNFSLQAVRSLMELLFVKKQRVVRLDELTLLMSENLSVERSNITASLNDEYSKVFGPERSGRVRCLGRGPTPSKLLKMSNTPNLEASNSEVFELKSQVSGLQSQVQNSAGMIQQLVGATTVQGCIIVSLGVAASNSAAEPERFLNPSICEYPTLEEDSSSIKERPEGNTIIGVKRSLSAFQKAQDQEKWPRKLGVMINSP
ncbi:hypothetical protein YC2023_076347 [Brassica napus]